MNTISLYLRQPFYRTMEQGIELFYRRPVNPGPVAPEKPLWKRIQQYAYVVFVSLAVPVTAILLGSAILIDLVKHYTSRKRYTRLQGNSSLPDPPSLRKVCTWNVCMLLGGLPIPFGGVTHSSERISYVADEILRGQPDLVSLQEVSQDAAYKLHQALQFNYKYFYLQINPDPLLSLDSGLFIASQIELKEIDVIPLPSSGAIKRAAIAFKAGDCTVITTHLEAGVGPSDVAIRKQQIDTILKTTRTGKQILLGDFNMERSEFHSSEFGVYFTDTVPAEVRCTATDYFSSKLRNIPPTRYKIDYIAVAGGSSVVTQVAKKYSKKGNYALSDHKILHGAVA